MTTTTTAAPGVDLATELSIVANLGIVHITVDQPSVLEPPALICGRCQQSIGSIETADTLESIISLARLHGGVPCSTRSLEVPHA